VTRTPRQQLIRALLVIVVAALAVRLGGFAVRFGSDSLQMDFASYYTAGESVRFGLSPYVNHIERTPPIWDGVNVFRHSRFLYPPLAAWLFQVVALFPYHVAKQLWMLLNLVCIGAAVWISWRRSGGESGGHRLLVLGAVVCAFHPLLTLLERGQIDGLTLLLLVSAFALDRRSRGGWAAGALIALATMLKLNCAFVVPFLALRGRWRAIAGFAAAGLLFLGLDLVVSGPAGVLDYVFEQYPRIAVHGEGGTLEMGLPRQPFVRALLAVEPGRVPLDGRQYLPAFFPFVLNASLVPSAVGGALRALLGSLGWKPSLSHKALLFLGCFTALFALRQRRLGLPFATRWGTGEPLYWAAVLIVILLCGPVTWAMNGVFLLAVVPIVLAEIPRSSDRGRATALAACIVGLALVGMPDPYGWPLLSPFGRASLDLKYVLGELLCLAGLLGLWPRARGSR